MFFPPAVRAMIILNWSVNVVVVGDLAWPGMAHSEQY